MDFSQLLTEHATRETLLGVLSTVVVFLTGLTVRRAARAIQARAAARPSLAALLCAAAEKMDGRPHDEINWESFRANAGLPENTWSILTAREKRAVMKVLGRLHERAWESCRADWRGRVERHLIARLNYVPSVTNQKP